MMGEMMKDTPNSPSRIHYAWIMAGATFLILLATAAIRARICCNFFGLSLAMAVRKWILRHVSSCDAEEGDPSRHRPREGC